MTKRRVLRLVLAILVCLLFIAFFSWSESRLGIFRWWHVYALVGTLVAAVLTSIISNLRRMLEPITEHVGFAQESVGRGARREYFMALVPMYFIVSAYLMQAAVNASGADIVAMILSIAILLFAVYLVVAAFSRKLPTAWVRNTYQIASSGAIVGAVVFAIDLIKATGDLVKLSVNPWFVTSFFAIGLLVVIGIMLFHVISVSGRN